MNKRDISRGEFVRFGALAGLVPVVSTLAACGGQQSSEGGGGGGGDGGDAPETTSQPASQDSVPETTGETIGETTSSSGGGYIALESEVSPGSVVDFQDGGDPAVLVRLDGGDFVAYSAVCTHQGCTVVYNANSGTLDCPCHGSVFEASGRGAARQGPAEAPLSGIPVEVRGGQVRRA